MDETPDSAEPAWASRLHDRPEQYEQLLRPGLRAVGRVQHQLVLGELSVVLIHAKPRMATAAALNQV